MATDRGIAPELRAEELDAAWFKDCRWLHLSGYSLLADPIAGAALAPGRLARDEGARVGVDLSSWSAIRARGPVRARPAGAQRPRQAAPGREPALVRIRRSSGMR